MAKSEIGFGSRVRISTEECQDLGGAILDIEEGKETDLVFHTKVKKIFYVLTGRLKVTLLAEGKMKAIQVDKGSSFAVMPGLVYQLHALERSVVVEFCNASPDLSDKDMFIVSRGSKRQVTSPGLLAQMSKTDLENLKVAGEKALAERTAVKSTDGGVVVEPPVSEPVESESAGPESKKTSKKKSKANKGKN